MEYKKINYLTDEELNRLIEEAEAKPVSMPDYLPDITMRKAESILMRQSFEVLPGLKNEVDTNTTKKQPKNKKREFRFYCGKVAIAAAVAIAVMVALPGMAQNFSVKTPKKETVKIEKNAAVEKLNDGTTSFCSRLLDATNNLVRWEDTND